MASFSDFPFAAHYIKGARSVNLRKYYLRRLTRLEPPYIVALFLLFILAVGVAGTAGCQFLSASVQPASFICTA